MANAILNIAGLLLGVGLEIGSLINENKPKPQTTTISFTCGLGANNTDSGSFGGNIPMVSLWNSGGQSLGQYKPGNKDKIPPGSVNTSPITIDHPKGVDGQAEYAMLTTTHDDAVCLTSFVVTTNGASWTWMGDIAYTCGQDWYPSSMKYGSDSYMPKCAWIDNNHSDGLRFTALSMHMPDFNGDAGLVNQYIKNQDSLCNAHGRYAAYTSSPDPTKLGGSNIYKPDLVMNPDGSDSDVNRVFSLGKNSKRDLPAPISNATTDGSVNRPGHVVISDHLAHDANEVCGSQTSRGPSFVSTQNNVYCDMSTKTAYPLCEPNSQVTCFDVDQKHLIGAPRQHARDLSVRDVKKVYHTHERWGPNQWDDEE